MTHEHGDDIDRIAIAIFGALTDGAWATQWPESLPEVTAAYRALEPWEHDEYRAAAREAWRTIDAIRGLS